MKKITSILGLILIALPSFSQPADDVKDPKAKAILEELSLKNASYSSIKAEFTYRLFNSESS